MIDFLLGLGCELESGFLKLLKYERGTKQNTTYSSGISGKN